MKHAMIKAAFAALRNGLDLLEKALLAGVAEEPAVVTRGGGRTDPPPEDPGQP